jgi:hypothetical protein
MIAFFTTATRRYDTRINADKADFTDDGGRCRNKTGGVDNDDDDTLPDYTAQYTANATHAFDSNSTSTGNTCLPVDKFPEMLKPVHKVRVTANLMDVQKKMNLGDGRTSNVCSTTLIESQVDPRLKKS